MNSPDDLRIAGCKTVANWKAMRARHDGSNDASVWTEAFEDFFKARLDSRYFAPIKALEAMKVDQGEGFSIVTLQCSLIEFLASTLQGKSYRYSRNGKPTLGEFEYTDSKGMFVSFLAERIPFNNMFDKDSAKDFYESVRCGLLHEACTKNGWRIKVDRGNKLAIDAAAKIVYRDKMQDAFDGFIKWYGEKLPGDTSLQQAIVRKFESLCID